MGGPGLERDIGTITTGTGTEIGTTLPSEDPQVIILHRGELLLDDHRRQVGREEHPDGGLSMIFHQKRSWRKEKGLSCPVSVSDISKMFLFFLQGALRERVC